MDLTEEALLEAIRRVLSGAGPEVRVGVGDDAAVLAPTGGELVITTDVRSRGSTSCDSERVLAMWGTRRSS